MIDLHCHYLPGVDDGAETNEGALELLAAAVADGVTHAVLTPHFHPGRYDNTLGSLRARFVLFRRQLIQANLPIGIGLAAEVRLLPTTLTLLKQKAVPLLGQWEGQDVVLLEMPHDRIPVGAINAVMHLRANGIMAMIAHPERNKDIMRDWRRIKPFVDQGCLLQITAASVCGDFGLAAQQTALEFLHRGWVTVMASDAHNLQHRPSAMRAGRHEVERQFGAAAGKVLTESNPRLLLRKRLRMPSQKEAAVASSTS